MLSRPRKNKKKRSAFGDFLAIIHLFLRKSLALSENFPMGDEFVWFNGQKLSNLAPFF
jgi:hypothetical protein